MVNYAFNRLPASGEEVATGDLELILSMKKKTGTVTTSTPDNTDVIAETLCDWFWLVAKASDAYVQFPMDLHVQLEGEDGSWTASDYEISGSQPLSGTVDPHISRAVNFISGWAEYDGASRWKYPFNLRVRCVKTLGAGTIDLTLLYV